MAFKDEIREQSKKNKERKDEPLAFPEVGLVDKETVNSMCNDIIEYFKDELRSAVDQGTQSIVSKTFKHYYYVEVALDVELGYNEVREGISFDVTLPKSIYDGKCVRVSCPNMKQLEAFLYNLDNKINAEFSRGNYSFIPARGGRNQYTIEEYVELFMIRLKQQWKDVVMGWKKNNQMQFIIYSNGYRVGVELDCDKNGIVK